MECALCGSKEEDVKEYLIDEANSDEKIAVCEMCHYDSAFDEMADYEESFEYDIDEIKN